MAEPRPVLIYGTNSEGEAAPARINDKGEFLLEEPIAWDGKFDGDIEITGNGDFGSITSSSDIQSGGESKDGKENGVMLRSAGLVQAARSNFYDVIWVLKR